MTYQLALWLTVKRLLSKCCGNTEAASAGGRSPTVIYIYMCVSVCVCVCVCVCVADLENIGKRGDWDGVNLQGVQGTRQLKCVSRTAC